MGIDEQHRPELFVVDIWKGDISAIREVCPSAVIIADKFHIIRLVNYALDFTRRLIQRQAKKGAKQIFFRPKHLLLKAYEHLTPKESERLMALFFDSGSKRLAKIKKVLDFCYIINIISALEFGKFQYLMMKFFVIKRKKTRYIKCLRNVFG